MSTLFSFLIAFVMALAIGIYLGKLLFSAQAKSEGAALEEKLNGLRLQLTQRESSIEKLQIEKEQIRNEKEALTIHLSKKKPILTICGSAIKNRSKK